MNWTELFVGFNLIHGKDNPLTWGRMKNTIRPHLFLIYGNSPETSQDPFQDRVAVPFWG
jgi:hypothetical protein